MSPSGILIAPMDFQHLTEAQALSVAVGWPHRLEDWAFLLALGRGAVALDGDRVIGTSMWWAKGNSPATLGMIIVAPERQGQGLGRQLMDRALAGIGPKPVMLNATKEGMPLYAKLGFEEIDVVHQHQGQPNPPVAAAATNEASVRPMGQNNLAAVVALDTRETGRSREATLQALAQAGEGLVAERNGQLLGYALARPFGSGHVIGPVVALDDQVARTLVRGWIERLGDGFVRIDVRISSGLSDWLASHGLMKVDEIFTMARGGARSGSPGGSQPSPYLFALASHALG